MRRDFHLKQKMGGVDISVQEVFMQRRDRKLSVLVCLVVSVDLTSA